MDAVERAVISMEDNPVFNAGTGSSLNLLGEIEMDAAIMDGRTLRGGGVALLRDIKNPVKAARVVMERTAHVIIAGDAARKLALENGGVRADLRVPRRVKAWREGLGRLKMKRRLKPTEDSEVMKIFSCKSGDTVGALCLDAEGNLAAADSTGGVSLKLPGRIGDSPILGAGLYADNRSGAATATGIGEQAIRLVISKRACDLMRQQTGPRAATEAIRYATRTMGNGSGLITLDREGRYGVAHNTRNLCWAVRKRDGSSERMLGTRVSA